MRGFSFFLVNPATRPGCLAGRDESIRRAARVTCAAAIMLVAAGCSQEVQRFDHDDADAERAKLHYNEGRYAQEGFTRWRHSGERDLRDYRDSPYRDPVTRSLPDRRSSPRSGDRSATVRRGRIPPPVHAERHIVRSGDTLFSVARSYDVAVRDLAAYNRLDDPGLIRVGDTLYIPGPDYQPPARRPANRYARDTAPRYRNHQGAGNPAPRYSGNGNQPGTASSRSAERLYADPLVSERRTAPATDRADSRAPQRSRDVEPAPIRRQTAQQRTREEPQNSQSSRTPSRRAVRAAPPPAPIPRPVTEQPTQIARAETKPAETTAPARANAPQDNRSAECKDLLKNPPARSGANFRRPVNGLIVSRFGEQSDGQRNDGINISVPRGTPVKAAENGIVVYAGDELTGLGRLVLVRHADGWVSAYAHNDEILVGRCDAVERGQMIARAGVSGTVSKPQLHFELRKNARPVDPEAHLAGTS